MEARTNPILLVEIEPGVAKAEAIELRCAGREILIAEDAAAGTGLALEHGTIRSALVATGSSRLDEAIGAARSIRSRFGFPIVLLGPAEAGASIEPDTRASFGFFPLGCPSGALAAYLDAATRLDDARRELESKTRLLESSESRLKEIADNMVDLISSHDRDNRFSYVSPSFERILGYRPEELLGRPTVELIHPEDRDRSVRDISEMLWSGAGSARFRYRRKDGEYRWIESTGRVVRDAAGNLAGSVMGSRDVTERKEAEDRLEATLREKDNLLGELQHRAKNSLGIVHSLLGIGLQETGDESARRAFRSVQDRIRAMAAIYEQLYRRADFECVDLREYIGELAGALLRSYAREGSLVLSARVSDARIDSKRAVPLGLIVNELVTNSIKYAYPGGARGEILVELESEAGVIRLRVADRGVGFPPGVDPRGGESTGLKLVTMLAKQIGATLSFGGPPGVEALIELKAK